MNKIIPFVWERLKERSTQVTIVTLILGVVGVEIAPEQKDTIIVAVGGVISAIASFWGVDKA